MRNLYLFLFEWKHFIRSPFKIIALVLFVIASVYGLHNGSSLYQQHKFEIDKIESRVQEDRQKIINEHYRQGVLTHKDRSWINYGNPYWAAWYSSPYHFKHPSPSMVYGVGQSEQYGFYKRITFRASPYDADLAEEIANPERLQAGTLDFSFAVLYLLPLVLLILLFNLKSRETEQGFMSLVEVQMPAKATWLFLRVCFYILIFLVLIVVLLFYGASLTKVVEYNLGALKQMFLYATLYLAFWSLIYFLVLLKGKNTLETSVKMSAVYMLFALVIPATVHQTVSTLYPANLMTDFIDVREKRKELRSESDSEFKAKLVKLFPEIKTSVVYQDNNKLKAAKNRSLAALVNELKKKSIRPVEKENQIKNTYIENTFWFNPVSFFQNRFNKITQTHFDDYQAYRNEIQELVDKQIKTMVLDIWNEVEVDEDRYIHYSQIQTSNLEPK